MTEVEVLQRTRAYVRENFLYMRPDFEFGDRDSLLKLGVVDSMGVVELIEFLQGEFGIVVDDSETTEENFDSLAAIGRYVVGKFDGRTESDVNG